MRSPAPAVSIDLLQSFAHAEKLVLVLENDLDEVRIASAGEEIEWPPSPGLVGKTASEVLPPDLSDLFRNTVRQVLSARREQRVTYSLPVAGTSLEFAASIFPLSPDSVLWLARNSVTTTFASLPVSHQLDLSKAIIENLGEGLCAVDLHGRLFLMNPAAQSLLGWTEAELSGRDLHDTLHGPAKSGSRYSALQCPVCDAIRREYAVSIHEALLFHKDGSTVPVSLTVSPISRNGRPEGSLITLRDISSRLALEEELRNARQGHALGQLAGGTVHDFNNLLTVINGYASFLLDRADFPDPLRENLNEIARAGQKAAALTQRLLAFGRRQARNVRVVDLNATLLGLQPVLRRLIPEDISLGIRLSATETHVMADPDQLEQVIVNLTLNARDATPPGGSLILETSTQDIDAATALARPGAVAGSHVRLTVKDTGTGMSPEVQARIFEPYFTTKDPGKGNGLGLSIVHGVVKECRGHLLVESSPNAGTSISVLLPRVPLPLPPPRSGSPALPPAPASESILLVEDDESVSQFAREVLLRHGYHVLTAVNGSDAVDIASRFEGRIDLLLSDVVVPGINGPDVAQRFLAERSNSAVLFMSGYLEDATFQSHHLAPGAVLLHKPFSAQELLTHVRRQLSRTTATIVVADDQPAIRALLRNALVPFGYFVIEAPDGRSILSICRNTRVDLIITDLAMPDEDGLQAIPSLRKEFPAIHIVAMSGTLLAHDLLQMALFLGAEASLSKPLDFVSLPLLVRDILRKGLPPHDERVREQANL